MNKGRYSAFPTVKVLLPHACCVATLSWREGHMTKEETFWHVGALL